jgi:hypothetical protein
MGKSRGDECIIMLKVETVEGDGYLFITGDAQRAIEQFEEWTAKFGADRVQGNEGFEKLARPLMILRNQDPPRRPP